MVLQEYQNFQEVLVYIQLMIMEKSTLEVLVT